MNALMRRFPVQPSCELLADPLRMRLVYHCESVDLAMPLALCSFVPLLSAVCWRDVESMPMRAAEGLHDPGGRCF